MSVHVIGSWEVEEEEEERRQEQCQREWDQYDDANDTWEERLLETANADGFWYYTNDEVWGRSD